MFSFQIIKFKYIGFTIILEFKTSFLLQDGSVYFS